jgi:hypothetical protein
VEKAMAIAKETKDDMALHQLYGLKGFIYFQQKNYAQAMDGNMSEWYNWYTDNKTDIFVISSIESMSTYLVCLKKLNRDYDLSQLEKLMKEKPERKYGYVTNYRLYQIYEENTFLKNAYDEIIKVKSNLDKRTGDKFINYPLESEIVKVYRSIS